MVHIGPFETIYPSLGRAPRIRDQHGALAMGPGKSLWNPNHSRKKTENFVREFVVFLFLLQINSKFNSQSLFLLFSNPVFRKHKNHSLSPTASYKNFFSSPSSSLPLQLPPPRFLPSPFSPSPIPPPGYLKPRSTTPPILGVNTQLRYILITSQA